MPRMVCDPEVMPKECELEGSKEKQREKRSQWQVAA
jgi:hypothetical protein